MKTMDWTKYLTNSTSDSLREISEETRPQCVFVNVQQVFKMTQVSSIPPRTCENQTTGGKGGEHAVYSEAK